MARLVSSLGSPGTNGVLSRVNSGPDYTYMLLMGRPGVVFPDSSSSVDIIKPNFGISNTFYFRFRRNGNLSQFQIMYRYRRRYAPSMAAAIDSSGSDVWTDWTDWTTENGTTGDPGEEIATVNISDIDPYDSSTVKEGVTWQKALVHTYKEVDEYDRTVYQFRVRVYNSVQNTCGAWTCWTLNVDYVPAITGLTVTKRSDGGLNVSVQTNYQRNIYAYISNSYYYRAAYKDYCVLNQGSVVDNTTGPDALTFVVPPAHVRDGKAYFRYANIGDSSYTAFRWLSCATPSTSTGGYCVFTPQAHVEPTLPTPTITTDTTSHRLQVYVASSGDNYTDVQGSAQWTDLAGTERTQALEFSYNSTTKKWTATFSRPPLDVEMQLRIAVVGDDWALHTATATVPSEGLVCFDSPTSQSNAGAVRLKYNQSISTGDEIAGETVECVGREFPISRYGGPLKRTIKLDAQMLNPDAPNVGGDGWKNSVECLTQPTDWILRIPGGEVYRVLVSSLDRNTATPTNTKVMDVSITCEVLGYDTV